MRYCGAPLAYAFDEAGQEKGVTILDTGDGSLRAVPVPPLRPVEVRTGARWTRCSRGNRTPICT